MSLRLPDLWARVPLPQGTSWEGSSGRARDRNQHQGSPEPWSGLPWALVFRSALMKFQGWPWCKLGRGWVLYSVCLDKFSSLRWIKMFWAMGKKLVGR